MTKTHCPFHQTILSRRKKNKIFYLMEEGSNVVTAEEEISRIFVNNFQKLFSSYGRRYWDDVVS